MKDSVKNQNLEERAEAMLEWPMIFLTLLIIPIMVLPMVYPLSSLWASVFYWADIFIWIAFYFELFIKLLVSKNYLKTLKKNWFLVVILLMPMLRLFRLARLARLLRVARLLRLQSVVNRSKGKKRTLIHNLEYGLAAFLIVVLISSLIVWQVEYKAGGDIQTIEDSFWRSLITVTTIGYGDVAPTSPIEKITAAVTAFAGVIIFMIVAARISSIFARRRNTEDQEELFKEILKEAKESKKE